MYTLYVGIDDTDSAEGMCTTYVTYVIMDELKHFGFNIEGYPRLMRLNPFARFKTRGNGALSFKLNLGSVNEVEDVKEIVLARVKELSQLHEEETNPGVIFYQGKVTDDMRAFGLETVRNIVSIKDAEHLANKIGAEIFKFKKGRGIIGALAAIGCPLEDKTYELLAYRTGENCGKRRMVDYDSVFAMDLVMYPQTFDNVDEDHVLMEPHTPCPILYGIRGESPEAVMEAHKMVKTYEPIERVAVFETNQHTDMHLQKTENISQMRKYNSYIVEGTVESMPYTIEGGHIIFVLGDNYGKIDCAAYEPTKRFRDMVRELVPGDKLRIYGGIGSQGTLNIEKIRIIDLAQVYRVENPICECGRRMKSAGRGQGYKCIKCGMKLRKGFKNMVEVDRKIKKGFYEVPPSARRHLSKPLVRC
jgi:tRNA(Ile2)-agmatinylcytidine synthase